MTNKLDLIDAGHILELMSKAEETGNPVQSVTCNPKMAKLIRPYLRSDCFVIENPRYYGAVCQFTYKSSYKLNKEEKWYTYIYNTLKKVFQGF